MPENNGSERGIGKQNHRFARRFLLSMAGFALLLFVGWDGIEVLRQYRQDARYAPHRTISLEATQSTRPGGPRSRTGDGSSLRVVVAPVISPEKSVKLYQGFVDFLADKVAREPMFMRGNDYGEVNELLRNGQCDLGFVCTFAFVRGASEFGLQPLVVPEIAGETTYHSLILVPVSSPARTLLDLRGKRFASADILSNSGWLFPAVWLTRHGQDARTFFGKLIFAGSHDRSIAAVCLRLVDGAAVDSLVYEQMMREDPSIAEKTRVLLKSPPFGMPPLVVPASIDPGLRSALLTTLLGMNTDEKGRQILSSLHIDRFVPPTPHMFDSVKVNVLYWEAH